MGEGEVGGKKEVGDGGGVVIGGGRMGDGERVIE